MKFSVKLLSMSISIRENKQTPKLVEFALADLSTVFTQRPGAQAIRWAFSVKLVLLLMKWWWWLVGILRLLWYLSGQFLCGLEWNYSAASGWIMDTLSMIDFSASSELFVLIQIYSFFSVCHCYVQSIQLLTCYLLWKVTLKFPFETIGTRWSRNHLFMGI